jgi:succinate dehydrogenase / fumarate reductase flavoprotein subunit
MELLIIGCGLAGLSAAIEGAKRGYGITLISPYPPERAQSVMAAGGINAALNTKGEDDSVEQHFDDTMKSGAGLSDEAAVRGLTEQAPELIRELAKEGVVFSRDEMGNPDLRYFGGQAKKRTVFSKAGIGKQLVTGLHGVMLRYCAQGKIRMLENTKFIKCILKDGRYAGILTEDMITGELSYRTSDALIVASGGLNGLFGKTTGSSVNDGSVTASLFASGIKTANLEMIQYHPTTIETPQKRMLISEAARGEGGRLFTMRDGRPWYFMEDWYGEHGNLMSRDVVSQCIYKVCDEMNLRLDGKKQVGLDLTHLDEITVHEKLAEVVDVCQTFLNINPLKAYIPVYPGIHYFMGGLYVDRGHRSTTPGIYAAGECACMYHGANRLGGNSTLGAIYGGRTAVQTAGSDMPAGIYADDEADDEIRRLTKRCRSDASGEKPAAFLKRLQDVMNESMGIIRAEAELTEAVSKLAAMKTHKISYRRGGISEALAAENLRLLGEAMCRSALERRESRGAQMRKDYPERDDAHFRKTMAASYQDGEIAITAEEVGRVFYDSSNPH